MPKLEDIARGEEALTGQERDQAELSFALTQAEDKIADLEEKVAALATENSILAMALTSLNGAMGIMQAILKSHEEYLAGLRPHLTITTPGHLSMAAVNPNAPLNIQTDPTDKASQAGNLPL